MRLLLIVATLAAALPASAQEGFPPLFIAPWGEPVRGVEGEAPAQVWFRTSDANEDGALALEEFLVRADRFFTALDRSQDGRVTPMESGALFRAVAPDMFAAEPGRRAGDGANGPDPSFSYLNRRERRATSEGGLHGAARFSLFADVEPVMSCDGDMSRWITREEFATCVTYRFRQLDVNGDGRFELSESPRAQALIAESQD